MQAGPHRTQGFTGWTAKSVAPLIIDELGGTEVLRVHSAALDRCRHNDGVPLTSGDLLRIGVAAVRQHLDLIDFQHLLGSHGQGVEQMAVVGVVIDVVVNDQATFGVDDALQIVGGDLGGSAIAHRPGFWLAEHQHLLVAALQLLLALHQTIFPSLERRDRTLEVLAV